jgi:beta-N-acetylhexosaminidase
MSSLSPKVSRLLDSMSVEQKVGQVFVFTFISEAQALQDLRLHPGGYIRLISDVLTMARQSNELQSRSPIPLIISADFERGVGPTIAGGTDFCTMMALGATGDEKLAEELGFSIASEAAAIGVNLNYVPVMDVNVNPDNPIINTRSFGGDPELVARLGSAIIRGHRRAGVLSCAKHFPGHGDTDIDSHTSLSSIPLDRDRLDSVELKPFRAAIAAGVDCIMSAHLLIPAIEPEPLPATLSRKILHGLLREELGFGGVVTSDALDMGAIAGNYPIEQSTILAFNAGCDQLIMPTDNRHSVDILLRAVRVGAVTEERLNEAVGRILAMKEKAGILDWSPLDLRQTSERVAIPRHFELARTICRKAATLLHDRTGVLPLAPNQSIAVLSISNRENDRTPFLEPRMLGAALSNEYGGEVRSVHVGTLSGPHSHHGAAVDRAIAAAKSCDVIIVAAFISVVINRGHVGLDPEVIQFLDTIRNIGKPTILVSFGSPYLGRQIAWTDAFVCAYGGSESCQKSVAELLCGKAPFTGTLPVSLT